MAESIPLQWTVGHSTSADLAPTRRVPAAVPGAVQLDWARAEGWAPHYVGDNWKDYLWMEDAWWTYSTPLNIRPYEGESRLMFRCGGIDYAFEIFVGDKLLLKQEGMFTPIELDLTDKASDGDVLQIRINAAPKSVPLPQDRSQANRSCKPAVSYGWDFHPRLIPLGIWEETSLAWEPTPFINEANLSAEVSSDLQHATLTLKLRVQFTQKTKLWWRIVDPSGNIVREHRPLLRDTGSPIGNYDAMIGTGVDHPQLWWPHDQGAQPRYESVVQLEVDGKPVGSEIRQKIGLRRVKLVMHDGQWIEPSTFPKSRSTPPITLEINGRKIFAKGVNWVSPDIFPGTLTRDIYEKQLNLAKQNHMNIIRLWGGAIVQKEAFYDLCDELGIMAWQEFPLACNNYSDDANYLKVLDQESKSIISRLQRHACVVLWCGGNELFNTWSGMTDQSHALRLLNANCFELDRDTPFLATSPVMGMGHGHYVFRDMIEGKEAWAYFQESRNTAYTEFGVSGVSSEKVLRSFIPEKDLWPPQRGTAWETHHGFGVWQDDSWLTLSAVEYYFGPSESLSQFIRRNQLMQAEGYKGIYEEARRQKPQCAMALCWVLNEPWPNAANNSLIAWPCEPKPALFAVGEACRPTLASARIRKFKWQAGEWFDPELWLLSDAPEALAGCKIIASIEIGDTPTRLLEWDVPALPANTNLRGPRVQHQLPKMIGETFVLKLEVAGKLEWNSTYTLCCQQPEPAKPATTVTPTMNL